MQTYYFSSQNHISQQYKPPSTPTFISLQTNLTKSLHFNYLSNPRPSYDLSFKSTELHKWPQRESFTERKSQHKNAQNDCEKPKSTRNTYSFKPQTQFFVKYPEPQILKPLRPKKHYRTRSNYVPGHQQFILREPQRNSQMTGSQIGGLSFGYEVEKAQRRDRIQDTKKAIMQFTQQNIQLLNDIKKLRNQVFRRPSPTKNPLDKVRNFSPTKQSAKISVSTNNSEISENIFKFESNVSKLKDTQKNEFFSRKRGLSKITDDNFAIIKKLGEGNFAEVFLAVDKKSGFLVTLKKIKKSILKNKKCQDQLLTEIKIQMFANHPNILKIYGCYADEHTVTLILEFMSEGNLYQKLKTQKKLPVDYASQSITEILMALKFLHHNKIVHRDIKPDNVVICYVKIWLIFQGVRKLCDFGTAALCIDRRLTVCGTLDYTAPELIQGQEYNEPLDLWSVGIMTHELLTGKPPFYHFRRKDTIKEIMEVSCFLIVQYRDGEINFPSEISNQSVDFIRKFLIKDPEKRMSIDQALKHKFITIHEDEETRELTEEYKNSVEGTQKVEKLKTN